MATKWDDDQNKRAASDIFTMHSVSVVVRADKRYITTVCWAPELIDSPDQWYSAWRCLSGWNQYVRLLDLDCVTAGEVGQYAAEILYGQTQVHADGTVIKFKTSKSRYEGFGSFLDGMPSESGTSYKK